MVPRTQGESVHKAQTSDHLTLCPTGMGVAGVDVVVVSIGELMIGQITSFVLIAHAGRWQTVQVQSVWGRSVHCAMH